MSRFVPLAGALAVASLSSFAVADEAAATAELAPVDKMIAAREWDDAEDWIYKYCKKNGDNAEALRKAGYVQLVRPAGDKVRAVQYLDKAAKLDPDNPVGDMLLAKAFEARGESSEALAIYDALIEAGPGHREPLRRGALHLARFNRALYAAEAGEYETATSLLKEVMRAEPQHAYASYELGLIAARQDQTEEAIEMLRKAATNLNLWAPAESWPYPQGRYSYIRDNLKYELGRQLLLNGDATEAKKELESVVDLVRLRANSGRRDSTKAKTIGHGSNDMRFENAPFYYGEAVAAEGDNKAASKLLKEFSKMTVGDSDLREQARARSKQLK